MSYSRTPAKPLLNERIADPLIDRSGLQLRRITLSLRTNGIERLPTVSHTPAAKLPGGLKIISKSAPKHALNSP
jgi:hypothetical protein